MCQYSACAVLQYSMRTHQRQQQQQQHQGGAVASQPYTPTGQGRVAKNILQSGAENVPRTRSSPHGAKMGKGRRSGVQNIGQKIARMSRCEPGNKSAGSSPTKQYYQHRQRDRDPEGAPASAARSRSYTPPSRDDRRRPARRRRRRSPSTSPNLTYAGARFSEPPSPKVLPRPPTHWFASNNNNNNGSFISINNHGSTTADRGLTSSSCAEMTNALKGLLKVQC